MDRPKTPALNPLTFKQVVDASTLADSRRSQEGRRYQVKVLKLLLPLYGMDRKALSVYFDGFTKDPWESVIGGAPEELRYTWVEHLNGVTLPQLTRRPLDTPAGKRFRNLLTQYTQHPLALVFPVLSNGDWVMHTAGWPEGRGGGCARIIVQARTTAAPDIAIEPLGQFINVRKDTHEQ